MNSRDYDKAQISSFADGELDQDQAKRLLVQLREPDARATWDLYHRIGDVIRSEAMAQPVSKDFGARFAARFESEPVLLAPTRRLLSRLGAWPTTLAAVAATGFGFFVAPALFNGQDTPLTAAPAVASRVPVSHGSLLADAKLPAGAADEASDYIRMHHASYAPMYGSLNGARTPAPDKDSAR